jgi:hypothetical protein
LKGGIPVRFSVKWWLLVFPILGVAVILSSCTTVTTPESPAPAVESSESSPSLVEEGKATPITFGSGSGNPYYPSQNPSQNTSFYGFNRISYENGWKVYIPVTGGIGNGDQLGYTLKGKRWIPRREQAGSLWNTVADGWSTVEEVVQGYTVSYDTTNRRFVISIAQPHSYGLVPWKDVKLEVKNLTTGGTGTYTFRSGIMPYVNSNYGQCTWWALKRMKQLGKNPGNLLPLYDTTKLTPIVRSCGGVSVLNYVPQNYDVLVRWPASNGHYAVVESVTPVTTRPGAVVWLIEVSHYNYPPYYESYSRDRFYLIYLPGCPEQVFFAKTPYDSYGTYWCQFNYYKRL